MKLENASLVVGILIVAAMVVVYPRLHAWLIDDGKLVVPGGRLATEWSKLPRRPGDAMIGKPRVFDKLSLSGAGARFESKASDEVIFQFYVAELTALGWELQPKIAHRREIQFCRNGVGAIIQVEESPGKMYYFGLISENQKRSLNYCFAEVMR